MHVAHRADTDSSAVAAPPAETSEADSTTALGRLLCRAGALDLVLVQGANSAGTVACAHIRRGKPRVPQQQQLLLAQQPEVLGALEALAAAAAGCGLGCVERLSVWGAGWLLRPPLSSLVDLLPLITHLDLAPDVPYNVYDSPHPAAAVTAGNGCRPAPAPAENLSAFCLSWPVCYPGRQSRRRVDGAAGGPLLAHKLEDRNFPAGCAALTLAAATSLFPALPGHLLHLSACLQIADDDRMAAWASALGCLPCGLTSLRLLGPLCHSPDLAAAVGSWSDRLPLLQHLTLGLGECCHSHPDLEGQLYEDPDSWTSSAWQRIFPGLTGLRSLQLNLDDFGEGLWRDACACSHLTALRLYRSRWSCMCETAGLSGLSGLRDLAVSMVDCSELKELSSLTALTGLDLELLSILDYDDVAGGGSSSSNDGPTGLLPSVVDGLIRLRHLRLICRSTHVNPSHLDLLTALCPELVVLEIRAPLRSSIGAGGTAPCRLPANLQTLVLEDVNSTGGGGGICSNFHRSSTAQPLICLAGLPHSLMQLHLNGIMLRMVPEAGPSGGQSAGFGASFSDTCPASALGQPRPQTQVVTLINCTIKGDLPVVCGGFLRYLDLTGSAIVRCSESIAAGSGGRVGSRTVAEDAIQSLRYCSELRRLGLWGCKGSLRLLDDAALLHLALAYSRLTDLALSAAAATPNGLGSLAQLKELRSLRIAVADQQSAAALGHALTSLTGLTRLEAVQLSTVGGFGGFVSDCIRNHLAERLPSATVHFRLQQPGD